MTRTTPAHERDHEPVPDPSTLMGLLHVLRKAHMELVGRDKAHQRFSRVSTRGDARQYIEELTPHLKKEREKRRKARGPDAASQAVPTRRGSIRFFVAVLVAAVVFAFILKIGVGLLGS
ncbi:hypothetical protein BH160DRAFT_0636 [Burkholderia sp. H160]|nr:hypothetical protein BH160DRAFT_0636 [Burkholderia sp. H160]